jgi:chromosome segregation ATPase
MAEDTTNGGAVAAAPVTLEEALAQIAGLNSTNVTLTGQLQAAQASVQTLTTAGTAKDAQIAELTSTVASHQADLESASDMIDELKAQLAETKAQAAGFPQVTVEGVIYNVTSGARGAFGNLSAKDIAGNATVAATILAIAGQKILVKAS